MSEASSSMQNVPNLQFGVSKSTTSLTADEKEEEKDGEAE
jgi:hypothetical protein